MNGVYTEKYLKKNNVIHRIAYSLFLVYLILAIQARLVPVDKCFYIMTIFLAANYIAEKILLSYSIYNKKKPYTIFRYVQFLLFAISLAFIKTHMVYVFPVAIILLMLTHDFIIYDAIDEDLNRFTKFGMTLSPLFLVIIFLCGSPSKFSWAVYIVLAMLAFLYIFYIVDYFYYVVNRLNDRNLKLIYEKSNLEDANNELIILRDKMKSVNEEVNYHKISLSKINEDLEQINYEIKSQNDVMKYLSSTFDVLKCLNVITEAIMEVKKPDICAFYISENVYMNKYPCTMITSGMASMQNKLGKCIADIYREIKEEGDFNNRLYTGNLKGRYEFIGESNLHAINIFPLFNLDNIYGIMLIASKHVNFFDSGTKYYESLGVEFSTALKSTQLYLQMEDIARKDGLTGIYNRVYFNELFAKECQLAEENNENLSVALFDIDKFKSINDTYGHLAGDEVIKMIANIDKETAIEYGGFACRYGGEEFLLVLPGKSAEVATAILESMHEKIKNTPVVYDGKVIKVNVSIGLTSYPLLCQSTDELIRRADALMYYSKEHGRGRLIVDGDIDL